MKTLGVGVIGLGFIGEQHLDALRRVPGVRLAAVCDAAPGRAQAVGERWGIQNTYAQWQDLIADPAVQAVHNCTPNDLHDPVNRAVLAARKHLYAEKPLAATHAQARDLLRLAQAANVAHAVNHQYRLNAAVQEMRARLAAGDAGRVFAVRGHYLQESNIEPGAGGWRVHSGRSYALSDIGIHWVDTACCVLGQRVASVCADLAAAHGHWPEDLEDWAAILLRFEDGTPGVLTTGKLSQGAKNDLYLAVDAQGYAMRWAQERPDRLWLCRRETGNEERIRGPHTVRPEAAPYVTLPAGHTMGWPDALRSAVAAFYAAIESQTWRQPQPYATFEDGAHGMAFVEACLESAQARRWVDVEK
jgi:predicted dehydrogenase